MSAIPPEWRARSPLMTADGWANLQRLRQRADAPRWNFETGDRLEPGDLETVDAFRSQVRDRAGLSSLHAVPPSAMLEWILRMRDRSWWFAGRIAVDLDLDREWSRVPTMSREDLVTSLHEVVPHDITDLGRLLSYDTSGTSGHAVSVPHDGPTLARGHALLEYAMARFGVSPEFNPHSVACLNLCAQTHTYVFATVFTVWNQAGFVKANLHEKDWAGGMQAARSYLPALEAQLLTSDPVSLAEAMRWQLDLRPRAILSTALTLTPQLRARFTEHFGCPVLDWYSTTETGPIAVSDADGEGWEILPHDLFVEIVDAQGAPVADGDSGEICVTGGRNPFLPLLRYRTGDFGRMQRGERPRLIHLQGRAPVFFRAGDGAVVGAVDVGRAVREVASFVQHAFVQRANGTCEVRLRPIPGVPLDAERVEGALRSLLRQRVTVIVDHEMGQREKPAAYRTELEL